MNPLIGPLTKVILLKLFLDIVPSSSADITRALCRCSMKDLFTFMSFRFVSLPSKGKSTTLWGCLLGHFDYKQGSFRSRYVLIHFET